MVVHETCLTKVVLEVANFFFGHEGGGIVFIGSSRSFVVFLIAVFRRFSIHSKKAALSELRSKLGGLDKTLPNLPAVGITEYLSLCLVTVFDKRGHNAWAEAYGEKGLVNWLFRQRLRR